MTSLGPPPETPKSIHETDAIELLRKELASGSAPKPKRPRKLPLSALREIPEVFQMRHELGSLTRFGERVAELFRRIRQGVEMDPLTVWWAGSGWVVIEGHHRLAAYREAAAAGGTALSAYKVPVQAFIGTLEEAKKKAGDDNHKARNPMHSSELQEWAWQLLISGTEKSPSAIVQSTSVSRQQVYRMIESRDVLLGRGISEAELLSLGWFRARPLSKVEPDQEGPGGDEAYEAFKARREATAQRFFKALDKEFGKTWLRQADALAFGLSAYHTQFARLLIDSEHLWPLIEDVQKQAEDEQREEEATLREIADRNSRETSGLPF